jgi:hypothetical protein
VEQSCRTRFISLARWSDGPTIESYAEWDFAGGASVSVGLREHVSTGCADPARGSKTGAKDHPAAQRAAAAVADVIERNELATSKVNYIWYACT